MTQVSLADAQSLLPEIPRAVLPFDLLPVTVDHICAVAKLPFQPNHNDPVDRLLVAQAAVENASIVSADVKFDATIKGEGACV